MPYHNKVKLKINSLYLQKKQIHKKLNKNVKCVELKISLKKNFR
jgi:hypothetical protein